MIEKYINFDYVIIGLVSLFLVLFMWLGLYLIAWITQLKKDRSYLRITPPTDINSSSESMTNLIRSLHSITTTKTLFERLFLNQASISLEVISSKNDGVQYYIICNAEDEDMVMRAVSGYANGIVVDKTDCPFFSLKGHVRVLKQTNSRSFTLRTQKEYATSDTASYFANAVNKMKDRERLVTQIVVRPVKYKHKNDMKKAADEARNADSVNHTKMYELVFLADIRLRVLADNKKRANMLLRNAEGSIRTLNVAGLQEIQSRLNILSVVKRWRIWLSNKRQLTLFSLGSMTLTVTEISSLYHFPTSSTHVDGVNKTLWKRLPPTETQRRGKFDVTVGESNYIGYENQLLGLTEAQRQRHVYITGGTGMGKSTLLEGMLLQDIEAGRGVCLVDPHGDLSKDIIGKIPNHRAKDVLVFDPFDIEYPTSINIMEIPDGLSDKDYLFYKNRVVNAMISIFRKVFTDGDSGGSRIESGLRNICNTALKVKDATLETMLLIVNNEKYRAKVIKQLDEEEDINLLNYWNEEIGEAGGMQRVKIMQGITTKLEPFTSSPTTSRFLSSPKSSFQFRDLMDQEKIIICNLSKGHIGEPTSQFLGSIIISQIQIAALERSFTERNDRKPFYLYVDEFQNFATDTFTDILSESRKYGLSITMAQQTVSQQNDDKITEEIVANTGTVINFCSSNPRDSHFFMPMYSPLLINDDIMKLPKHHFYIRFAGEASEPPMSGSTTPVKKKFNRETYESVINYSRKKYGTVMTIPAKKDAIQLNFDKKDISKPSEKRKTSQKKRTYGKR